jgi:hypothetical protein
MVTPERRLSGEPSLRHVRSAAEPSPFSGGGGEQQRPSQLARSTSAERGGPLRAAAALAALQGHQHARQRHESVVDMPGEEEEGEGQAPLLGGAQQRQQHSQQAQQQPDLLGGPALLVTKQEDEVCAAAWKLAPGVFVVQAAAVLVGGAAIAPAPTRPSAPCPPRSWCTPRPLRSRTCCSPTSTTCSQVRHRAPALVPRPCRLPRAAGSS